MTPAQKGQQTRARKRALAAAAAITAAREADTAALEAAITHDVTVAMVLIQEAINAAAPGTNQLVTVRDLVIIGYGGGLTLEQALYTAKTIRGDVDRPGYSVTMWRHIPATRESPEEMRACVAGRYPTISQAAAMFVKTLFTMQVEDFFQRLSDAMAAEAWAEGAL